MTPYGVRVAIADGGSARARRAGPPPVRPRDRRAELDAERMRLRAWRDHVARSAELMRIAQEMELERLWAPSTASRTVVVYVSGTATASSVVGVWGG